MVAFAFYDQHAFEHGVQPNRSIDADRSADHDIGSDHSDSSTQRGLRVRRYYVQLRAALQEAAALDEHAVVDRMRSAAEQLGTLWGSGVCGLLGMEDRLQLQEFQRRVPCWLTSDDRQPAAGLRVWHDHYTFVSMLTVVNRRHELRRHDAEVLERLGSELDAGATVEVLRPWLDRLMGLDDELDRVLPSCWQRWLFSFRLGAGGTGLSRCDAV